MLLRNEDKWYVNRSCVSVLWRGRLGRCFCYRRCWSICWWCGHHWTWRRCATRMNDLQISRPGSFNPNGTWPYLISPNDTRRINMRFSFKRLDLAFNQNRASSLHFLSLQPYPFLQALPCLTPCVPSFESSNILYSKMNFIHIIMNWLDEDLLAGPTQLYQPSVLSMCIPISEIGEPGPSLSLPKPEQSNIQFDEYCNIR
jgi:hypothetical protein